MALNQSLAILGDQVILEVLEGLRQEVQEGQEVQLDQKEGLEYRWVADQLLEECHWKMVVVGELADLHLLNHLEVVEEQVGYLY